MNCFVQTNRFFTCLHTITCRPLSDVICPTADEGVDKLRKLLPENSSRPPTRIQAATLKRNKKATWQRFLHSLHFLRGSHGISMFSLLFVSIQQLNSQKQVFQNSSAIWSSAIATLQIYNSLIESWVGTVRRLAKHKGAEVRVVVWADDPVCSHVNISSQNVVYVYCSECSRV